MTTQLLFYESAVPVSRGVHGGASVQTGGDFGFARNVNSVQLMAVEFPAAAAEYAIVFAGNEDALLPAVILGVRNNQNLFLAKDGSWQATYIPAFVRRYPFVFSSSDDGKTFTLCLDESFPGFNREGRGQPLFGEDGNPSPYVGNVLKFLREYQAQFQRTQAFCRKVRELGLLEPMQAQISTAAGERLSLGGFWAVNRGKVKALPGDKLAELARTDELELLYLHLQSMRNFDGLRARMAETRNDEPEAPAQVPAAGAAEAKKGARRNAGDRAAALD
jgi:hypothetical protein